MDEYGNLKYYSLQPRTIFKHASRLLDDSAYVPLPRGGLPSIINNPDGAEFIAFLKQRFVKATRTAQNCMQYEELNKFIRESYKLRYYSNQDASAPDIPKKTLRKLRGLMKAKGFGAARYVSARRWEAMGDPRNYMSMYIGSYVSLKNVPLELRFNWDETSLFVAGEQRNTGACVGMAFTAEEVANELDLLNRSPGIQHPAQEKGRHCTPRMVPCALVFADL